MCCCEAPLGDIIFALPDKMFMATENIMMEAVKRGGDRLVTEKDSTAWVCYLRD